MKEWLTAIIIASAASGMIASLAPDGGMRKFLRYVCALAVTLVLLSPLKGAIGAVCGALDDFELELDTGETVTLSDELYDEMVSHTLDSVSAAMVEAVYDKYGVEIEVELTCDASDYQSVDITGATVTISDADALYRDLIEEYISETLCCEVEFETK